MLITYIVGSAGTWLQTYLMAGVAQYAVRDMRTDLFGRLQSLPVRFFDQHTHGDLMSRLTNDVENIANVLASSFSQLVSSVLSLVGVVIFMFMLNRALAVISLVVMPLTFLLTRAIAKRTRAGLPRNPADAGQLNGIIEETVTGERTVKAFVREQTTVEQFSQVNRQLQKVVAAGAHLRRLDGTADEHGQQPGPGDRGLLGRLAGGAGAGDGRRSGRLRQLLRAAELAAQPDRPAVQLDPVGAGRRRAGLRADGCRCPKRTRQMPSRWSTCTGDVTFEKV